VADKIDRKQLKRPDEFQLLAGRAMGWMVGHKRLVLGASGAILAALLIAWGLATWRTSREAKAGGENKPAAESPKNPAEDRPRDQWKKLFHPAARKNDDEKGSSPPLAVKGVGDEAFWMGNAISGGLYVLVLENDTYFRISLGGSEEGPVKIERAKTLARRAIPRLRGDPPG